jgi:hypothetical protein
MRRAIGHSVIAVTGQDMLHNQKIRHIFELMGIDPARVPAKRVDIIRRHVELIMRFVGYKAGLAAAKHALHRYDIDQKPHRVLGDFMAGELFERDGGHGSRSLYHEVHVLLAAVEGATGYPLTSEAVNRKTVLFFWRAVLAEIKNKQSHIRSFDELEKSEGRIPPEEPDYERDVAVSNPYGRP